MQLPEIKNTQKYVGLYVVDFGDATSVGFTADEVAELFESEKFKDIKAYKIHNAKPDGTMELRGVTAQMFQLESGMFFAAYDLDMATADYKKLVSLAVSCTPPGRAKVHLAKRADDDYVVAIVYPAEYSDEFSSWLLEGNFKTLGQAHGGTGAVQNYYAENLEILERHQLFGQSEFDNKTGDSLLVSAKIAVQR
jgi:hypothetical protein